MHCETPRDHAFLGQHVLPHFLDTTVKAVQRSRCQQADHTRSQLQALDSWQHTTARRRTFSGARMGG